MMDYTVNLGKKRLDYPTNKISTAKYSYLTYFPRIIYYIFAKVANLFFLIVSIFISIPGVAPLSPLTVVVPFFFVILVAFIRETIEDLVIYK